MIVVLTAAYRAAIALLDMMNWQSIQCTSVHIYCSYFLMSILLYVFIYTYVNYVAYIMSWHISMHVNVSTHAPFTPQGRVRPIGAYGYAALYAQRGKELRHFVRLLRVPLAIPQLTLVAELSFSSFGSRRPLRNSHHYFHVDTYGNFQYQPHL